MSTPLPQRGRFAARISCLLVLFTPILLIASEVADNRGLESQVEAVTVYLDRAVVTRVLTQRIKPGRQELILANLPLELEDAFLRARIPDGLQLDHLRSRTHRPPVTEGEAHRELRSQINELDWAIKAKQQAQAANQRASTLLEKIQAALLQRASHSPVADAAPPPSLEELSQLATFHEEQGQRLSNQALELDQQLHQLRQQRSQLQQDLANLDPHRDGPRKEVVLTISNPGEEAIEGVISVEYLVPGALWYPTYELRDLARDHVELEVAAVIQNATGEDWPQARITLSTARSDVSLAPAVIHPWLLGSEQQTAVSSAAQKQQDEQSSYSNTALGNRLPEESLRQQLLSRSKPQRQAHQHLLANIERISALSESLRQRSATVAVRVQGREHIAATGEAQRVILGNFPHAIKRHFLAQPGLSADVSAQGKAQWNGPWPLLPGDLLVQREGVALGRAQLPFVATGENLVLPLGIEERLVVREEIDEAATNRSTFSGSNRLEARKTVHIHSLLDHAVPLHIRVRLPHSDQDSIRVRHEGAKAGTPAFDQLDQGIATWDVEVAAGSRSKHHYAFQVEWPSDLHLPSLEHLWRR